MNDLYALSSYALADIAQIWNFMRQHNLDAASRVEMELLETCELLASNPGLGHRRVDYTKADVLFLPVYSYLIDIDQGQLHCRFSRLCTAVVM
jgi:plasmid stabilization system protein ParE